MVMLEEIEDSLACPACGTGLRRSADALACPGDACGASYPIVDGVPVVVDETKSLFRRRDLGHGAAVFSQAPCRVESLADRLLPDVYRVRPARLNLERFARELRARSSKPMVLVVGGGVLGAGMSALLEQSPPIVLVETDAEPGPRTRVVCDAHDLPFSKETFDGVVLQAVLQHVVDPARCVDEAWRVLTPDGLVYAQAPFMHPVHARLDFTRFTPLGLRWLFRRFDELDAGVLNGPGTALGLQLEYFLLAFATKRRVRGILRAAGRVAGFPLKYADAYLAARPGGLDSAAGCYFFGAKAQASLPEDELLGAYRGGLT
jgi:SAM-dependent methyltransferase